jgi:lysozyme family protein
MSLFDQAFAIVVGSEGGFDRTEADPGNWTGGRVGAGLLRGTKFGISAASYPGLHIAALTLSDAQAIYRRDYWDRVAADRLPPSLALLVFDAAVNSGTARAARWLQGAVGAAPDGDIGGRTVAAVAAYVTAQGEAALCTDFTAQRLVFLAGLPTWPLFGLGWARRVCALPYHPLTLGAS